MRTSDTHFYKKFKGIEARCNSTNKWNNVNYKDRGIKCLWNSFEDFKNDMYDGYIKHVKKYTEKDTQIDRIDNNGNYCKENCRWVTHKENQNNRRNNHYITWSGYTLTLKQWSEKLGINYGTLAGRVKFHKSFFVGIKTY